MAVIAFDGSKFTLPGSDDIRKEFDDETPILKGGGRYFPHSLVMTAFDVFRKIPVARTISHAKESERKELMSMFKDLYVKSLLVLDRGYFGYEVFNRIMLESEHEFLAKVPMKSTFKEVTDFIKTGKSEGIITINPTTKYFENARKDETKKVNSAKPLTIRAIRTRLGEDEFLLLTSLLNREEYSTEALIKIYQARWEIENYYRDEKMWLTIEEFMTESVLGIKQELFSTMILSVVTRVLLYLEELKNDRVAVPQYYNAITSIAKAIPKIIALGVERAKIFVKNLVTEIIRTRYYKAHKFRSYPRISRKPHNRWKACALTKLAKLR